MRIAYIRTYSHTLKGAYMSRASGLKGAYVRIAYIRTYARTLKGAYVSRASGLKGSTCAHTHTRSSSGTQDWCKRGRRGIHSLITYMFSLYIYMYVAVYQFLMYDCLRVSNGSFCCGSIFE